MAMTIKTPISEGIRATVGNALRESHLGEYFGVWAIHEETFRAAVDRLTGFDLRSHVAKRIVAEDVVAARDAITVPITSANEQKLAVVSIDGPMMKYASSLSGGTSTVAIRQQLRALRQDDSIAGVMLKIFSPGGTVSGNQDLADEVTALAGKKPVHAFIEDLGASAAYWIASQTQRISTNATGMVGSIGTFAVITDSSKAADQLGFKVHVVRAGEFKGAGVDGTEVTEKMLAEFQRNVDALNEHFLASVEAGRKMTPKQVKALADGRVHVGHEAVDIGLADAVSTFDEAMAVLADAVSVKSKMKGTKAMSDEKTAPAAATLAELKAAFPSANAEFRESCQEAGMTIASAHQAFALNQRDIKITSLEKTIGEQSAEIVELKASLATEQAARAEAEKKVGTQQKTPPVKPGVAPLGTAATPATQSGDARADWDQAVAEKQKAMPHLSRQQAVSMVAKEQPQLRESMVAAAGTVSV